MRVLISCVKCCTLLALALSLAAEQLWAGEFEFLRVQRDGEHRPISLQTSIASYSRDDNAGRVQVDLISAVHIGEKSYYQTLNREFEGYHAVLYELIAPAGAIPGAGVREAAVPEQFQDSKSHAAKPQAGAQNPVSALQIAIKNGLQLEFQLEGIDYSAPNLVHADMSADDIIETMRRRDETFLKLFMRLAALGYLKPGLGQDSPPDLGSVAQLLLGRSRHMALRRLIAAEFSDMRSIVEVLNGSEGLTLLSERNKAALQVLAKELEAGQNKLAIFYGAAHMSDFERRLIRDLGFKPGKERWLIAWDLVSGD